MRTAYLLAGALVVVAAAAIFMFAGNTPPAPPFYYPSNQSHQDLVDLMDQGGRIGLAAPDETIWKSNGVGMFEVGVRNVMNETQSFYMNIYNESDRWMSFTYSDPGSLQPDENRIIGIDTLSASGIPSGKHVYTLVVCTQTPCETMKSDGLYAAKTIEVDIE